MQASILSTKDRPCESSSPLLYTNTDTEFYSAQECGTNIYRMPKY